MSGNKTQTSTSGSQTTPINGQGVQNIANQIGSILSQPFNPFGGQLTAPINQQEQSGINTINNAGNNANSMTNQAEGLVNGASNPLTQSQINQYENPYNQQVVQATENQFNLQNAQQQNQLTGSAAAAGALGGDRQGVAQAQLAGQQQTNEAPVIAGLEQSGYNQALQTAQQQFQQNPMAAANLLGQLGSSNEANQLGLGNAQLQGGELQQQTQQAQDTGQYQQYLNQQGYPFQIAQLLGSLDLPTILAEGQNTFGQQTTPGPSILSQILGGITGGAGLINGLGGLTGGAKSAGGAVPARFAAGGMPYGVSGLPYSGGNGYVPTGGNIGTTAHLTPANLQFGKPSSGTSMGDIGKGLSSLGTDIKGIRQAGNTLSNWGSQAGNILSGDLFGSSDGVGTISGLKSGGFVDAVNEIHGAIHRARKRASGGEVSASNPFASYREGGIPHFAIGGADDIPDSTGSGSGGLPYLPGNAPGAPASILPTAPDAYLPPDAGMPQPQGLPGAPGSPFEGPPAPDAGSQPQPAAPAPGEASFTPQAQTPPPLPPSQPIEAGRFDQNSQSPALPLHSPPNPMTGAEQPSQPSPLTGNAAIAYQNFIAPVEEGGWGLDPEHAAAQLSNWIQESQLNPLASGDHGTAGGIMQWRGDRLAGLYAYAKSNGQNPNDFQTQLAYARQESLFGNEKGNYQKFLDATGAGEAANAYNRHVERSADTTNARAEGAENLLDRINGGPGRDITNAQRHTPAAAPAAAANATPEEKRGLLGLTERQGNMLLNLGAGMLASTSPFPGVAFGQGLLRVSNADLAGQRLAIEAAKNDGGAPNGLKLQPGQMWDSKQNKAVNGPGVIDAIKEQTAARQQQSLMTDEDAQATIRRYLSTGDPQILQGNGRSGADQDKLRHWMPIVEKEMGLTDADVGSIRTEFEGAKSAQRTLGVQSAKMGTAGVEMLGAINQIQGLMDRLPRTSFLPLNQLIQGYEHNSLNPDQIDLETAARGIVNAYAGVMSRGANVSTDASRARAEELLNTAFDQTSWNRVIRRLQLEAAQAVESPQRVQEIFRQRAGNRNAPGIGAMLNQNAGQPGAAGVPGVTPPADGGAAGASGSPGAAQPAAGAAPAGIKAPPGHSPGDVLNQGGQRWQVQPDGTLQLMR